jgi:exodeoxyribonuclease VIII
MDIETIAIGILIYTFGEKMELSTMIDLETLATTPDAVILQIAAVKFDPFDDYLTRGVGLADLQTLDIMVDVDSQPDRNVNPETLDWWAQQDPQVQERIFSPDNRVAFKDALMTLHRFVWNSSGRIWCQGTSFDISILEHAYRAIDHPYPWRYWQARDSRTLLDLVAVNLPVATHDAVADCYRQATGVQQALATLGVTKFVR